MQTAGGSFRSLRVYDLATRFSDRAARIAASARCSPSLKEQLVRASESVVLNIAEGAGHLTARQKLNAFRIAHGSTGESIAALDMIGRHDPRLDVRRARWDAQLVARMLTRLIQAAEAAAHQKPATTPPQDASG